MVLVVLAAEQDAASGSPAWTAGGPAVRVPARHRQYCVARKTRSRTTTFKCDRKTPDDRSKSSTPPNQSNWHRFLSRIGAFLRSTGMTSRFGSSHPYALPEECPRYLEEFLSTRPICFRAKSSSGESVAENPNGEEHKQLAGIQNRCCRSTRRVSCQVARDRRPSSDR